MESNVQVRCMKNDLPLIKAIKDECIIEFQKMIKQECNREIHCNMIIDENNMLDEKNNNRFYLKQFFI